MALAGGLMAVLGLGCGDGFDPHDFQATVDNAYFPLKRGTGKVFTYEPDGPEELRALVMPEVAVVAAVPCTVLRETEHHEDRVTQDASTWFAQDIESGDVYAFGRDVTTYADGEGDGAPHSHRQAWTVAGGRPPVLVFPGNPQLGDEFGVEAGSGIARVVKVGLDYETHYGEFTDAIRVEVRVPGEETRFRIYAPGAGLIAVEEPPFTYPYPLPPPGHPPGKRRFLLEHCSSCGPAG